MTATGTDPRLAAARFGDVRPVVARARRPLPGWLLAVAVLTLALLLFVVLESHRQARVAPATRLKASDVARLPAAPPPLFIPPEVVAAPPPVLPVSPPPPPLVLTPVASAPVVRSAPPRVYQAPPSPPQMAPQMPPAQPRQPSSGPTLVIDTTAAPPGLSSQRQGANAMSGPMASMGDTSLASGATGNRVRAGEVVNRATTVPQGTLIPAVLETALDSTRPGQVRALVSRDVRSFDGSQVLIPRGSRLFGEYRADLRPGQKRALVQWTRLVRPDGVSIAIGSPAADPLGRAGIRGKVNSHFFERFGSAILQSTLDIGVAVGTQRLGGSNVVLVPGAAQAFRPNFQQPIQPTLTVRQGARVTVFVANDLDFTGAGSEMK